MKFQRSTEKEEMLPTLPIVLLRLGGRVTFFTIGDKIARSVIETTFQKFGENVEIMISEGMTRKNYLDGTL